MGWYSGNIEIAAPTEAVFDFHTDTRNLPFIMPTWMKVKDVRTEGSGLGMKAELRITVFGIISNKWKGEIIEYRRPNSIIDQMTTGPTKYFRHERTIRELSPGKTVLQDTLNYELPLGFIGRLADAFFVNRIIKKMFEHRHQATKKILESRSTMTVTSLSDHVPVTPIPKRVESDRLILKRMNISYAEEYYYLEKEGMQKHLGPFSPVKDVPATDAEGIHQMKEAILTAEERWDAGSDYRFLIVERSSMKVVGQIGITNVIRGVAQSAFVGYWIGYPFLNQGYATEACEMIFRFAFTTLRLHRLSLWIATQNAASLQVVAKLGLRYEGRAERALHLGGQWKDTEIYAITSEEWQQREDTRR